MNITTSRELPERFRTVNPEAWTRIYAYGFMFIVAFFSNTLVLVKLCRRQPSKLSSINKLLCNLCVADLTVAFAYMAVEVVWRISIGWYAGDFLCKFISFFRAFGLYLSSFTLMSLSLDRFYAICHPFKSMTGSQRIRSMLTSSWLLALFCASPQCFLFREENHPFFPEFRQCVTIWSGETAEAINTVFSLAIIYFLPLGVIIFSYGKIVQKLFSSSGDILHGQSATMNFPRQNVIQRAKFRALKLSVIIVFVFEICWTPFVIISLWHIIDRKSAEKLDAKVQDLLFMMACATPCVNPLVYGCFSQNSSSNHRQAKRITAEAASSASVFRTTILKRNGGDTSRSPTNRTNEDEQYVSDIKDRF